MGNNNNNNNDKKYKYKKIFGSAKNIETRYLRLLNTKTKNIESRVKEMKKVIKELFSVDVLIFPSQNSQNGIKKYSSNLFLRHIKRKAGVIVPRKKKSLFEPTLPKGDYFIRIPIEITTKHYATNAGRRYHTDKEKIHELAEYLQKKYEKQLVSGNNKFNADILSFIGEPRLYILKNIFRTQFFLVYRINLNTDVGQSIIEDTFIPIDVSIRSRRLSQEKNTNVVGQIKARRGKFSKEMPKDLEKKQLYEMLILNNN